MVVNDPIADMLTRIRNAPDCTARRGDVPASQHEEGDREDPSG